MDRTPPSSESTPGSTVLLRRASDERLARLAGKGSERAFAALYERYHQPLYRLCLSILRTPDDAHDALQSTFERALNALQAGDRAISVRPWLFRIAHNESISALRRRRPEDVSPVDDLPALHTVEAAAEERARLSALVADINALPARQRSALLMRELSGLSIAEIGLALSMSSGAVKQALFEARGTLHEFAEGRAMTCDAVRRAISDGDGRALRGRRLRAHLRDCSGCAEFRSLITQREADLRVLAPPLPAAAAAAVLSSVLSHGAAMHTGAAAGAPALAAAKTGASSLALKGAAALAVTAAVGAGAARLVTHSASSPRPLAPSHAAGKRSHGAKHAGAHAGAPGTRVSVSARKTHSASATHSHGRGSLRSLTPVSAGAGLGPLATVPGAINGVRAHGAPAQSHSQRGKHVQVRPKAEPQIKSHAHETPEERGHVHAPAAEAPAHANPAPPPRVPHASAE